jgi:hypothetical protein
MTRDQLQRECDYNAAISIANGLLKRGLITSKEYAVIQKLFLRKYAPVIAGSAETPRLFS